MPHFIMGIYSTYKNKGSSVLGCNQQVASSKKYTAKNAGISISISWVKHACSLQVPLLSLHLCAPTINVIDFNL